MPESLYLVVKVSKRAKKVPKKATNWTYNVFSKKRILNQICGFFQHFLALFDTFTTRYSHSDIKLKFSDQFQYIKHFISKMFLKMNLRGTSDLCAVMW